MCLDIYVVRMAILEDRAPATPVDLDLHPATDAAPRHHPTVRLLDRLPVIRFVCETRAGGGQVVPLIVEGGGALRFTPGSTARERWEILRGRIDPDDADRFRPPDGAAPPREIRLADGPDHRLFALADEVGVRDGVEIWQGVLFEQPAEAGNLAAIAARLPGALYRCEIEGDTTRCTFVSPAVLTVFGLSVRTFMESPDKVLENVHPDDRAWLQDAWRQAAVERALFDREFRILDGKQGGQRWVRSIAQMSADGPDRVVANGIAVDITRRRLAQEELERRNRELLTLCRISEIALTSPTVASGLEEIAGEIARHLAFPITVIAVFDEGAQVITFRGSRYPANVSAGPVRVPIRDTLSWECIRTGQPVVETDALSRHERRFTFTRQSGNRTFVGVPIKLGERAIGCLSVSHPDRIDPEPSMIELLASWADYIASFIASKGREELVGHRTGQRSLAFEAAFASKLTPRQREVLHILASGKSNKTIAQELGLQEATVKIHVRAILKALGVRNRTQAAMVANAVDRDPARPAAIGR